MPRGKIAIGGKNVTAGYFKNEETTREVYKVDERGMRWFYTGDIGRAHPDGCLEIIDRKKKDIVKLQHGEYVSLGRVEAALIVSPYVDNTMLHVDPFHSYCVALVVPAPHAVENWASKQGITYTDFANAAKQARIEKFEIPSKIELLPEAWPLESGLVAAALRLKREHQKGIYGRSHQVVCVKLRLILSGILGIVTPVG